MRPPGLPQTTAHNITGHGSGIPLQPATVGAEVHDIIVDNLPEGVRVITRSSPLAIDFSACTLGRVTQAGGSTVDYRCRSLTIDVLSGSTTVEFTIESVPHEVVISAGGSVTLLDALDEFGELRGMTVIVGGVVDTVTMDGQILTPGQTVPVGDCATLLVQADKHTVGSGSHPGSTKDPLVGILVGAYDKSAMCVSEQDRNGNGITWHEYADIVANCTPDNTAVTDAAGVALLELSPGDYIVISHFDDDNDPMTPDIILGASASDLLCGELKKKHLQLLVDANGRTKPGKTTRLTGSELLIIEPEYVLWDQTQQLYPLVFETIGEWAVATSVTPPEGFVADYNELSQAVNNDLPAVQFTITELGSDLVPTRTTFQVQHNGRRRTMHSEVGIQLTPDYARSRGFDVAELRARGLIREQPGGGRP